VTRRIVTLAALGLPALLPAAAGAQDSFAPWVVRDFRVEGAQLIEDGTIYNYLPINIGDTLDQQRIREAMRALYDTEFFRDIELRRDGSTLVIAVAERPRIESFTFEGNKDFKDEDLEKMLEDTEMVPGKIFDRSMLEEMTRFLTEEYYAQGKYAAVVDATVEEVPGSNRVRVHINIEEGGRARIREINIVGNTVYTDEELLAQFELQSGGMLTGLRKKDRYAKEALEGDLETLRSYYMDRGYADFRIAPDGVQVSISPDKTDIFISVDIHEGEVYRVSTVDLSLTPEVVPKQQLQAYLAVQPGQPFSQQFVTFSEDAIKQVLGAQGYAFAEVQTLPELDSETHEVALTFFVEPRSRVYVRRVTFTGTEGSNDDIFRREVRQLEGGVLANQALVASEERIRRLPYVEEVSYETTPVVGSADLVDVEFDITEGLPGSMGGSIGYSDAQGVVLGGDFVHSNFLGTGNRVQFNLNGGEYYKVYSATFTEPYRNMHGISRQIAVQYQDVTQYSSVTSDFSTKTLSGGMTWGLPIANNQTIRLGFNYQDVDLLASRFSSSNQALSWVANNGENFDFGSGTIGTRIKTIDIVTGYIYERRNRAIFPDAGMRASFNFQFSIPGSDIEYYVTSLNVEKFFPIRGPWRLRINSEVNFGDAYGDETTAMPPYRNFFGGGPNSVRGFKENYLGPRDSFGNPNGGNLMVLNQLEIIFPTPAKFGASARIAAFLDVGGVFHTNGVEFYDLLGDPLDTSFDYDAMKRAYGIGVQWLSPMGLLQFSYAVPLNDDQQTDRYFGDQTEGFQFTIGQAF
jgi:outer membrane protein insertion porin family